MSPVVKVIRPVGILAGSKSSQFQQEIAKVIESNADIVLINFVDITFMDSGGLGALTIALKSVRAAGGKMFLCSVNEQLRMLFELTSMDSVFKIYKDEEDFEKALASIR